MATPKKVAKIRIVIDLDGGNAGPGFAIDGFGSTDDSVPSFRCNSDDGPNMIDVLRDVFSKVTAAFGKSTGVMLCTDGNSLVQPALCGSAVAAAPVASAAPMAPAPAGAFHAASAALQAAAMALQAAALHTSHPPEPASETPEERKPRGKKPKRGRKRGDAGESREGASDPKK